MTSVEYWRNNQGVVSKFLNDLTHWCMELPHEVSYHGGVGSCQGLAVIEVGMCTIDACGEI